MAIKQLKPGDPEVVAAVIGRIRSMSREELLQQLRRREDFDEAWVKPVDGPRIRGPRKHTALSLRKRR